MISLSPYVAFSVGCALGYEYPTKDNEYCYHKQSHSTHEDLMIDVR